MSQEITPPPVIVSTGPPEDLEIKGFLEGSNPKVGVVAIETSYNTPYADVVIHDPVTGKKTIEKMTYSPFCYVKDFRANGVSLYGGDVQLQRAAMSKHGIEFKQLRVTDDNGSNIDRLNKGYKYLVLSNSAKGYYSISRFFAEGGVDMYAKRNKIASFRPIVPEYIDSNDLYTLVEKGKDCTFWYNNSLKRFEGHIPAQNVSRYVDNLDEDISFIRVKADGDSLEEETDYTIVYNEDSDIFIISFAPEAIEEDPNQADKVLIVSAAAEKAKNIVADFEMLHNAEVISGWFPYLTSMMPDKFDMETLLFTETDDEREFIEAMKTEKRWKAEDQRRYKAAQRAFSKYEKSKMMLALALEKARKKIKVAKVITDFKKVTVTYKDTFNELFFTLRREEQFMIQTGIRMFKGYEKYSELHKFIFDFETTGLYADRGDRVFMIGCRDNRGTEKVLTIRPGYDIDDEERRIISELFFLIKKLKPALIYGYNSENFDFDFLVKRAIILKMGSFKLTSKGLPTNDFEINGVPTSLFDGVSMKRRPGATIKYGGEQEEYTQTLMRGYNVIDILHAVRRTQAINSNLKEGGLKYVCKFEGISKSDRVYIPGQLIYTMWSENKLYAVHPDGTQYKVLEDDIETPIYGPYTKFRRGADQVEQYLIDDLWETQQVDERYNESSFLIGKLLPTFFSRTSTMGGAAVWNLIMSAWSFEKGLSIPYRLKSKTFTGGLSRTFTLGKFSNVYKFDFASLYPSLQLEHLIFPKHDVTNALKRFLLYFKNTRDVFKVLANDYSLPADDRKMYKAKQLPLKILNNSNFGANGSSFFNWSDFTCAERITCLGRLYLRNMIQFFMYYGCKPTVCDTDGINMEVPLTVFYDIEGDPYPDGKAHPIELLKYTFKGKEYVGADALVAKYNGEILNSPFMKLDNDGTWPSALNFSRKNYANMESDGEIKFVGNTLKDKTMPEYVKEFVDNGIRMLLVDKGKEFVDYYYSYLETIYTMQVPLKSIANKAKVKMKIEEYLKVTRTTTGKKKPKQAHMELIIQNNIPVNLGDVVYYVSTGVRKSHGYSKLDKSGKVMAALVTAAEIEDNPLRKGSYNVSKYIDVFNKKVATLLVAFKPEVRSTMIKDDPTKKESYTDSEMLLIQHKNPTPKDDIDMFFELEPSEVAFWNRTGFNPKEILQDFTTTVPYYGYEYVDKLDKVRGVMAKKGQHVYSQHDFYKNDSLVLTFEDCAYVINTEDGETEQVPPQLVQYFHIGNIPVNNESYRQVEAIKTRYGSTTQIKTGREYTLCACQKGKLNILKKLSA